jgi:hypothetical protein
MKPTFLSIVFQSIQEKLNLSPLKLQDLQHHFLFNTYSGMDAMKEK